MTGPIGPGAFVAVTGASGVGKDTLLDIARERSDETTFFPRRAITRPPGPGEEYTPLSADEFAKARTGGAFAAYWNAHGLDYGIPVSADDAVRAGRVVVANVSRGALDALDERYERLVVVRVTVSDEVRARRLANRNRESPDDIVRRMARADPSPSRPADHEIRNDGSVEDGSAQLLRIIAAAHSRTTPRSAVHPDRSEPR
ncbi:MAG: phnN [Frondihabitans sp.]|nr:phnN [Frondihabitans sp.]